jgi:hypothetical protein
MMDTEERKIFLELSEHDALQLLNLILKKMYQDHKPWRPYWKYLAQKVEQSIEDATTASVPTGNETVTPQARKISDKPEQLFDARS